MSDLSKRLSTSMTLILFVIAAVFIFPNWFFCFFVTSLIGIGMYEFFAMVSKKGIFVYKYFGTAMGVLLPVIIYLKYGGFIPDLEPFLIVFISLFVFVLQFARQDNSEVLAGVAITLLGILYISWFFSFIIRIKYLPAGNNLVAFLLVVTKSGDMGAYLIGSLMGRHSLLPKVSPKKTVEGTLGGVACSILLAFLAKGLLPQGASAINLVVLGVLLGVLCQIGDLSESLIKRDCKVKDAGRYLPGLGGVLDVIDSLLFTTPIFYFYIKMFF